MLVETIRTGINTALLDVHTAIPGVVESFDSALQTVSAEVSVTRLYSEKPTTVTLLVDVPIIQPSCGLYSITLPIKKGDEILLIFAERCIDNWFERGGLQPEAEHRMHDLSDGFALVGLNCKPNALPSYETGGLSIRNRANDQKITLFDSGSVVMDCPGGLTINGDTTVNGEVVTSANVKSGGDHVAGSISLQNHVHTGVRSGSSTTGTPV